MIWLIKGDRAMNKQTQWIWQQSDWPHFHWSEPQIQPLLRNVRLQLGQLLGNSDAINQSRQAQTALDTLLQNIITSSAIEGERLNAQSVRSSLAQRLGINQGSTYPTSDRSEGLAKTMLDAVDNLDIPLHLDRLLQWHRWLFAHQALALHPIRAGLLRDSEPMQVVSGRIDRPTIHFEAPPRTGLETELHAFLLWFNQSQMDPTIDPLLRAGIAHFWFVTLHPFEDGNGRIARTLTDLALAQANAQSIRLYAMSMTILERRNAYYDVLETSQRADTDITPWLLWFLNTLAAAIQHTQDSIAKTLNKTRYWHHCSRGELLKEQCKVLNHLLDGGETGFEQGISAAQYQKVAKVSKATATRHLADLLAKGCIEQLPGGGRSTRYRIRQPE